MFSVALLRTLAHTHTHTHTHRERKRKREREREREKKKIKKKKKKKWHTEMQLLRMASSLTNFLICAFMPVLPCVSWQHADVDGWRRGLLLWPCCCVCACVCVRVQCVYVYSLRVKMAGGS